jgi:hypothetical protein
LLWCSYSGTKVQQLLGDLHGDRTCKRTGHTDKIEKGAVVKPGFYVAMYNKGGKQKVGILEDTLMSEKEAQERAGTRGTPAVSKPNIGSRCRPYPSHRRQSLRYPEGNPTQFEKGDPERMGRREAGCETSSQGGR